MVRFSDMLGGSDDSQAPPTTSAPLPDPAAAEALEPEPEAEAEVLEAEAPEAEAPEPEASPEEVLERLTQYAADHAAEPVPSAPPPPASADDDLLPHAKRTKRRG